jgi:hypothetical protein
MIEKSPKKKGQKWSKKGSFFCVFWPFSAYFRFRQSKLTPTLSTYGSKISDDRWKSGRLNALCHFLAHFDLLFSQKRVIKPGKIAAETWIFRPRNPYAPAGLWCTANLSKSGNKSIKTTGESSLILRKAYN